MTQPNPAKMTDSEIAAELSELRREADGLRQVRRRFRADAHRDIDASVEAARQRVTETLTAYVYPVAHAAGTSVIPEGIADLWVLANVPEVAQEWHRQVDAASAGPEPGAIFGPMDRPEWESRRAAINERITALEQEQEIRTAQQQREAADARLIELGRKLN